MIPDPEAVITSYMTPGVQTVGAVLVDQTPDSTLDPWVRLTLLDAPADHPDHLVAAYVQFDVYAGTSDDDGHEDASFVARTVRKLLETDSIRGTYDGATVTGARLEGYQYLPDGEFEPARDRYILTATVWMHG